MDNGYKETVGIKYPFVEAGAENTSLLRSSLRNSQFDHLMKPATDLTAPVVGATADQKRDRNSEAVPSFTRLSEAVSFIVSCLDHDATNLFSEAFIKPVSETKSHQYVFAELKRINKTRPLPGIYEGKDFPTNQPAFTLGGHMKELACVHIGFVNTNGVWFLSDASTPAFNEGVASRQGGPQIAN